MNQMMTALAPVFAAALGIQQMIEILSPILDKVAADHKKVFLGVISLAAGLGLAFGADLHILQLSGVFEQGEKGTLDVVVTGLIISGGTEGVNSLLKFMKYKKEETKNQAAADLASVDQEAQKTPTARSLEQINKK